MKHGELSKNQMKKALISFVIEQSLIDGGGNEIFTKTMVILRKKFNCDVTECYNNPVYLVQILNDFPTKIRKKIISIIKEKLKEFDYQAEIHEFVSVIDTAKKY